MKSVKFMLPTAAVLCGLLFVFNSASAQTWTPTSAPITNWTSVASSADGTKLAATAGLNEGGQQPQGGIYVSTNAGASWTQTSAPITNWICIASSADGTKLVAGSGSIYFDGAIYISTDSGKTWIEQTNNVPIMNFASIASSADGTKLVAIGNSVGGGVICTTSNSGVTWNTTNYSSFIGGYITAVASSADGTKLVVVSSQEISGNYGVIYTSTNSGVTWIQQTNAPPFQNWDCVASSADGTKLVALSQGTFAEIYTSTDSGVTWVQQTNTPFEDNSQLYWLSGGSVASSADGTKLAATGRYIDDGFENVVETSPLYTSTDSGATWTSNNVPNNEYATNFASAICIAPSADGSKLVASSGGYNIGGIYILQSTPTPLLNIAPSNDSFTLSWIVPSTNFVLQQSFDLSSWSDVTNTPTLNLINLQDEVVLSPTNNDSFYRLESR
jgi:photosystem II stability/assembly factor-like uncharacterized protein